MLMDVAIMYSGGKDSTLAIEYAMSRGWNIKYLLSVKPSRKDCYLFHYATVEHTKQLAEILGFKHILIGCDVADAEKEAELIREVVEKNPVEALVLGGVGLQETQLKSLQNELHPFGVEVFASHAGMEHDQLVEDMIARGYDIRITQVAVEGLGEGWLGEKLTKENFDRLKRLSQRHGFHIGFEGGHADTLVVDGPIFKKRLELGDVKKVIDDEYCGHIEVGRVKIVDKNIVKKYSQ